MCVSCHHIDADDDVEVDDDDDDGFSNKNDTLVADNTKSLLCVRFRCVFLFVILRSHGTHDRSYTRLEFMRIQLYYHVTVAVCVV